MNATSRSTTAPKPASVCTEDQPYSGASMIVQVSSVSIAMDRPMPGRSSRGTSGSRDSGTRKNAATAAARASGTRAQNTLPQ